MGRIVRHFRKVHQVVITDRAARRLADTVRAMEGFDPGMLLGVTGSDVSALVPRRVDVTLGELRSALRACAADASATATRRRGRRSHVA
jgi:actin-like ATPase involved in cell morphogenesis